MRWHFKPYWIFHIYLYIFFPLKREGALFSLHCLNHTRYGVCMHIFFAINCYRHRHCCYRIFFCILFENVNKRKYKPIFRLVVRLFLSSPLAHSFACSRSFIHLPKVAFDMRCHRNKRDIL